MKRTLLASCILLSGCYVDPNTGEMYPAQQYRQRQVLVYHYQVPPPNPYYQGRQEAPLSYYPTQHEEWRPPPPPPEVSSRLEQYNRCAAYNQERNFQNPMDCGAYLQ